MDIFGAQLAEMRKQDEQKKQDDQRAAQKPQPSGKKGNGDPYSDQLAAFRNEQKPEKQPVKQTPANAPGVFGLQKQTQRTKRADDVLADVASGKLKNTPRPVTYKPSNTNPQMQEGVTVNPHRGINFAARDESTPTSNFFDRVSLAARGKTDAISDSIAREKENKRIETDPTVLNYRAAEEARKEAQKEVDRLNNVAVLEDDRTVLKDGTVLRPGEREEKLAKAQEALDFRTKQSANFAKNMTKDQLGMEKHPVARTAWQMIERGAAELSHDFAGLTNAVLGQHGIIGSLLEDAGGMFGDGINNLLQMDLINSEYIRSGDWNPVTMFYNANTNAHNTVMQMSNERLANNKNAIFAADIGANTIRLLPHFFLAAYEQAIGAASAASATTASVQQAANIATAQGALNLTGQLLRASASRMIKDPSIQVMFAQEFGRSYNVAKEDGAPNAAAIVYALTNSSISTVVEMSGGVQNLPAALQGVAALGKRELYILSNTVAEEMNEEVVQGFFERGLKTMYQQVELYSETNPNAMVNPNVAFQEAAGAALGTLFQIPVQRGIGRVVGHAVAAADYRANANSRAAFDILDKARQVDEKNDNDEATIAALNEINSNSKLREGFLKIYKTDVGVVLHEFMQSAKEEQSAEEQNAAPVQETSQEATGEQQAAPQAETPPAPAEAPTAAPVELNSQERAMEAEQSGTGTEVRDDTSSALQAPSPQGEGSAEAAPEAAPPAVETPTEAEPEAPAAVAEAPDAEAPAPAQPAAKKTTATEATRKLQEKYGDGLRTQETRGKIQSLARQASETDFSDPAQVRSLWESAKQQAREILNTTEDPSARTGGDTGGEIRNYLRGQKIRIDERLRNDRPSEYESLLELRRKTFGTLNFSNTEGMTLDVVYQELGIMFGEGLFPQDTMSDSEIVERILDAVANEKGRWYTYEQSLSDAEYERAAADLAMELMRAAEGVTGTTIPTPVRETQQSLTLEQEREAAIESELDADFEGELTREDAERIVDERYEAYGEYDLDKILNGLEDNYGEAGEEADDFDEYAYYAERYRAADAENADEAADAGGTEELPETVGQGAPERGLAAYEPAGVGEVRGSGSLAPDGEVSDGEGAAESGPEPGQKRSKTESHTLQNMAERLGGEQDELYYTPKSERESLSNAINRVDADMGGEMQKLLDKEMWNGEDIDTALTIQGMLQLDGVQTGDFSAAQAWARAIQARGTESGRALQAFSKWTRSGVAAAAQSVETLLEAENLTEEDRTRIGNDVYQFGRDFDSIEDGDLEGIRDLIKRQARYRNTWTFGKTGFERMLNEVTDFEWLKEYAMRQLMNIPGDYTQKADIGQQVKTWQVLAQLSRLGTFFRNIGGNGVFGIQDTLSQDFFGVALDAMLGKITGKRTLGLDKGWLSSAARKGARQGLVRSVLEVAGDVDMGAGGSKYGQGANRTFKMSSDHALSRVLSRWEQLQGYSLTTSDRAFRGGIEAEQQRGLSGFENLTEEERQALAQNMADYRLFQNHGAAYSLSKGLHDLFNIVGFGGEVNKTGPFKFRQGGFGVVDLANPYPGVPANLGVKALEYSPLNVAKGLTEMVKLLSDAKTGGKIDVKKQQNAVMDIARGLHGTALLAGLAALFKAGLFKNADDDDDKDAKALANAEGRQGVQMNLSGALRYLQGGSAEWKDGDQLMKIDWLEPMNAFLAIASMAADENDLPGYVGATFDGTLQSILDMPVMESFSNIFDNYNYSKGETVREKLGDVAVGFAADALTGMLPAPVSQTARAMDPYYRETIGEDAADTALRRVMNAIPGLRQQLDPKLDNFGRPKEQASSAYNRWMNSFVRPGQISDYKLDDVDRALDEFAQRTGEAVYPDRKAPNSFSADGQKIQLSGEEKQAYQETYGQAALQYYGEILLGDEYKDASDGEKQWLLDQAEAYATYQAKKTIMEQRGESYSNSSWDKMDALEEKGGDPFGYLFAKQGMKTATENKDYSTVDALLGDIDKMDKATQEQLFADVNRLDDRVEAHKAGIDTVLWEAAYAQKKKLEEDKNTTAVQDTISFAQWADSQKDLNQKQKDLLRDQMGFYTTFRADAEKFDKLTGAGLSADKAGKVWNAINALQPLEGHAGVTQNQRLKAISSMGNLSDAEKWSVLELYASESAYKKAMDAKAKGWTFDQWVQSFTKVK